MLTRNESLIGYGECNLSPLATQNVKSSTACRGVNACCGKSVMP